ncbi:MAG: C40 family peptidase [Candidatus Krumholzibacteriia bacterium]
MIRSGRRRPPSVLTTAPLLLGAALVALLAGTNGCAPKRVLDPPPSGASADRSSPSARSTRTARPDTATSFDLPRPGFRPRSGPIQAPAPGGAEDAVLGARAAELATAQIGKPYSFGAIGPDRFDCSGLIFFVYGSLGVSLPRVARDQMRAGVGVSLADARPGDLLFFRLRGSNVDHVGMYLGDGRFVHAPNRSRPISVDLLDDYWRPRLRTVRRVLSPQGDPPPGED